MFAGNKASGMVGAFAEVFIDAACQRYTVRSCCNVVAKIPKSENKLAAGKPNHAHLGALRGQQGKGGLRGLCENAVPHALTDGALEAHQNRQRH